MDEKKAVLSDKEADVISDYLHEVSADAKKITKETAAKAIVLMDYINPTGLKKVKMQLTILGYLITAEFNNSYYSKDYGRIKLIDLRGTLDKAIFVMVKIIETVDALELSEGQEIKEELINRLNSLIKDTKAKKKGIKDVVKLTMLLHETDVAVYKVWEVIDKQFKGDKNNEK